MTKEFWINLPVKDIHRSKAFFQKLGFRFNEAHGGPPNSACMLVGAKNVVVMLFEEPMFKGFVGHSISDTAKGTEVLFSIDAENREEVDELAQKAEAAGGTVYGPPGENGGWMYGCGFIDLDGHRWNVLYMDMSKLPKQ